MMRVLIALCLPVLTLGAQANRGGADTLRSVNELGIWLGAAHGSNEGVFGHAKERDLALTTVRWTHELVRSKSYSVDYVLDLLPVVFVSAPSSTGSSGVGTTCANGGSCALNGLFDNQQSVYGIGTMPVGFQLRLAPHARVQPFVSTSGGVLWFSRPIPDPEAGRFNFAAEVGAGTLVVLNRRVGLLFGYEFHHLSNGGTATSNPGIDSQVLYAGATTFLRE